jgi:FKBP-type peptidyl-prolyl cis-trans isomerase FkpA
LAGEGLRVVAGSRPDAPRPDRVLPWDGNDGELRRERWVSWLRPGRVVGLAGDGSRRVDQRSDVAVLENQPSAVELHYTGWLTDGTKFGSSRDWNEPISFRLGAAKVLRGLNEGVAGMKIGGKRRLTIPAHLGYGADGTERIPPNATLVFEVELLGVK